MNRCLLLLVSALVGCKADGSRLVDVPTQHYDNQRTGANLQESLLSPATVGWDSFGLIGNTEDLQGHVLAQPLFVSGLKLSEGTRNVLIVTTDKGWLYYFDADAPAENMAPLRKIQIESRVRELYATPVIDREHDALYVVYKRFADVCPSSDGGIFPDPQFACTSPACAPTDTCLYSPTFYDTFCDECYEFKLARFQLSEPTIVTSRIFSSPGTSVGVSCSRAGEVIPFEPVHLFARPGLLLSSGTVYAGFGAAAQLEGDPRFVYHGWIIGFDPATLGVKAVFCTTPHSPALGGALTGSKSGGGVWQSGSGLAGDSDGNIYFETGNGFYSSEVFGPTFVRADDSFEDSFVKLPPLPAAGKEWLTSDVRGVFTPGNGQGGPGSYHELEANDLDLGSGGPTLLPDGTLVGGGKYGAYHHLRQKDLGEIQTFQAFTNSWNDQWEQATLMCATVVCDSDPGSPYCISGKAGFAPNIHAAPLFWKSSHGALVYAWAEKDYLKAYPYDLEHGFAPGGGTPLRSPVRVPDQSMPGSALSLSANGGDGGIVWGAVPEPFGQCDYNGDLWRTDSPDDPINCDALESVVPGRFFAFDASTLELLFEDRVSKYQKFANPIVVNGRVFVPTLDDYQSPPQGHNRVLIYGARAPAAARTVPLANDYRPVDVDGDGKHDLMARDGFGYFSIWRSDGRTLAYHDGFYGQTPACPGPYCPDGVTSELTGNDTGQPIPYDDAWNQPTRFFTLDLNGDRASDLLARHADGRVDVWLSDRARLGYVTTSATNYRDADGFSTGSRFVAGHFDGGFAGEQWVVRRPDGTCDLLQWDGGRMARVAGFASGYDDGAGVGLFALDLDGNGIDELLARHHDGSWDVWTAAGTGPALELTLAWSFPTAYVDDATNDWSTGGRLWPLRINHKGALLARAADGTFQVSVAVRNAAGHWSFPPAANAANRFAPPRGRTALDPDWGSGQRVFPADLDGDGTSELLFRFADGTFAIWRWNGQTFSHARDLPTRFNDRNGWSSGVRFF